MIITKETNILIVGLGLMGGSYARALSKQGYTVRAIAHKQEDIDYALQQGMICQGAAFPDPQLIAQADLTVFALYPQVFIDWIRQYQPYFHSGALLTDVTGVKGDLVGTIQDMLRQDLEFIPAHPMAGREVYGVRNSDERIFQGANYIVTPTPRNTPQAIAACEQLGQILGFARISQLSPKEHDEMIAFVSQLTHCIAVSLMTCNDSDHLKQYTGDSFRDLTRIARINDAMWSELFLDNREALLRQMDLFSAEFLRLRDMLARQDREQMREMMRRSTARRIQLDEGR